ncbi:MAG: hypothetical protein JXR96_19165 [Deltaproteobacteria bacterium]|nr:hypothetical protein [Deltaproteobacteria bacterium]
MEPDRHTSRFVRQLVQVAMGVGLCAGLVGCPDYAMLDGKACDELGRCLDGYVCDPDSSRCVRPGDGGLDGDGGPDGGDGVNPCLGPDGEPVSAACDGDALVQCQDGQEVDRQACPLGCMPDGNPPRCYRLAPSNLSGPAHNFVCRSSQPLVVEGQAELDTDRGEISIDGQSFDVERFVIVGQDDGPDIAVFDFTRIEIHPGASLIATGGNALALLACEELVCDGVLDASGSAGMMVGSGVGTRGRGGPGGYDGGDEDGGPGEGPGAGSGGEQADCEALFDSGGGGGAYGGAGGAGGEGGRAGDCFAERVPGGSVYGSAEIHPLVGGSGGGGGSDDAGGPGGGGGGAVQLGSGTIISIGPQGGVRVAGGGGAGGHDGLDSSAGGGGGAGGAVLLEAPMVSVRGFLAANGGGGGAGYGDNIRWSVFVAASGEDGAAGSQAAEGGPGEDLGGSGGMGAAAGNADAHYGQDAQNGGGGGGGAGRIRIHTRQGNLQLGAQCQISPSDDDGACSGLCSQGEVQRW